MKPAIVTESEQRLQSDTATQMAVLEQAGLVRSSNTTAAVHRMLDALHGPTPPQPVKRYKLNAEGQKYFQKTPGIFGQTTSFCYGDKTVDSIVKCGVSRKSSRVQHPKARTLSQACALACSRRAGAVPHV